MDACDRIIDILSALGRCLTPSEEPPSGWRSLGEALLGAPGVRGVAAVAWRDEAVVPFLRLGDVPCDGLDAAEAARKAPWYYDAQAAPVPVILPAAVPLLMAPLGRPGSVHGVLILAADDMDGRLARVAEAVAAGLSAAMRQQELASDLRASEGTGADQVARIEELATVGQLAASVAHELRNPLSSIKGAAQYLRAEYEGHVVVREFLDIILEEVGVLSRVTSEFLDFARPMHLKPEEADIHESVRKLLHLMKPQLAARGIETVLDLSPDVPPARFDAEQIDHALRNVVVNAIQAMSGGGTLTVRTRPISAPLPGVEIRISDTGPGIPMEDLAKLFTPFFTTKTKGVGLGLTIVRKIAQNHGGSVAVESQAGCGSTFTIRLPAAPGAENLRVR